MLKKYIHKKSLQSFIFDVIFLYSLFKLLQFFVPDIVSKVTYSYSVYYHATHGCFPHYTNIGFALLLILPHFLLILLFTYLYLWLATQTKLREYAFSFLGLIVRRVGYVLAIVDRPSIAVSIEAKEKYISVFREGNNRPTVWKQLRTSLFITLFFVAIYYLLKLGISDKDQFFQTQLLLSHWCLAAFGIQFLAVLYSSRKNIKRFLKWWFSEPGSAYNLAIFRIIIGNQLFEFYKFSGGSNAYWAALPKDMRVSLPYMGWFIQNLPISPVLYHYAVYLGIICTLCIIFGFCTRLALVLNIPLSIYILGVPLFFGKLFHLQIWVWFPAILAFSSCGDVLSVDWLIKKLLGKNKPIALHPKYRLPLSLVWMHLGIIYFFAGITKLKDCGFAWALSDSMTNQIYMEWAQWYNRIPSIRVDHYPALLHVGGMAVILFEIFYLFLIFSSMGRVMAFFGGLAMHNMINYMMYIGFEDLQRTYVSFVNWQKIVDWFQRIFLKTKPDTVVTLSVKELMQIRPYKWVFMTGMLLFTINFTCGLFHIDSWPFSSYPSYSAIVPGYRYYIYFKTYDKQGKQMIVYDLGKKAHFRMESFTPIEDRIYENMHTNDSVTLRRNVHKLWDIWIANVPALKYADTVAVYMRTTPIIPEKTDSILDEKYLMSMKF